MNLMALLDDIEAVQERLDNGQYGYCLETGKPIDIERMLANPIAQYTEEVEARRMPPPR